MRRAFAATLVLIFSLPLIAPVLVSASAASQLPACCRRSGKHHCAMSMEMGNISTHDRSVSEKCPFSDFAHTPLMRPHAFPTPLSSATTSLAADPAAIVRAAEAGYRISADRARHKRGPPRLLAL